MATAQTIQIGPRGDVLIPADMRQAAGLAAGTSVTVEERQGAIIIRRALPEPELYTPTRQAELLLSNAVDADDYAAARAAVRQLGLDPDVIPHAPPAGV